MVFIIINMQFSLYSFRVPVRSSNGIIPWIKKKFWEWLAIKITQNQNYDNTLGLSHKQVKIHFLSVLILKQKKRTLFWEKLQGTQLSSLSSPFQEI